MEGNDLKTFNSSLDKAEKKLNCTLTEIFYWCSLKGSKTDTGPQAKINGKLLSACKCYPYMTPGFGGRRA